MEENKKHDLSGQISSPSNYVPPEKITGNSGGEETDKVKKELENFKKELLKKFKFSISLSVIPANASKIFEEDEGLTKEEIERKPLHLMWIIPEDEFKNIPKKIKPELLKLVKESGQNLWVHIKTPVDIWNYGMDSKYEFLDAVGGSFPLHDTGFLGSVRVAVIHKTLVLRKFDKYVASYVIGGSLVRGAAGKDSDVDTFVIIDDTDVKRMSPLQLLERLRGIIYDYIREASALAGVKNILNVQVWLLTDFWDSVKDANPVMFTFIRDGVPLHDRGTFLPWKLLLQRGKIKPSLEAVDKFMKYGEQSDGIVKRRLLDAMVDIYWGVVTPTQALMMLAGNAPPTPKTMVSEVKKEFVDKEKIMSAKDLKFLEKAIKLFKDYEHGKLKEIPGKEIDLFLEESKTYDKNLKEMRKKLEGRLVVHTADQVYDDVFSLLKSIFGNKNKEELAKKFEIELVKKGKLQKRFLGILNDVSKIKQKVKTGKVTQESIDKVKRDAGELVRVLTEYMQRKELMAIEKGTIRIISGDKRVDVVLTDSGDFVLEGNEIRRIANGRISKSDIKEMEKSIADTQDRANLKLSDKSMKALGKIFGNFDIMF